MITSWEVSGAPPIPHIRGPHAWLSAPGWFRLRGVPAVFACDCVVWREAYQNFIFNNNSHCPPDWRTVSHVFHLVFFLQISLISRLILPHFSSHLPHTQILKSDAAAMPRWSRSSGAAAAATAAVCLEHIASHLSHHPHKLINLGGFSSVRCGGIFSTTRDLHFFSVLASTPARSTPGEQR